MDDEEYEFEYEDEDENDVEFMDIENDYYTAKSLTDSQPDAALDGFRRVAQNPDGGKWSFKAWKRIVKLHVRLQQWDKLKEPYQRILQMIEESTIVTKNDAEKSILSLLDRMTQVPPAVLVDLLTATQTLATQHSQRLWMAVTLRLGKVFLDAGDMARLQKVVKELNGVINHAVGDTVGAGDITHGPHRSSVSGSFSQMDESRRGTYRLEVCSLEIQMCTVMRNNKRLRQLYEQSKSIRSAIPHPRIMAVISECGGKMYTHEKKWQDAFSAFFEAFKNYDEAGHPRRLLCLRYLMVVSMLMGSRIDPFDSQEVKSYRNDPTIRRTLSLFEAYKRSDMAEFLDILRQHKHELLGDDDFIRGNLQQLLENFQLQTLQAKLQSYSRIRLSTIAKDFGVSLEEAERLCMLLIMDGRVEAQIDQPQGIVTVEIMSTSLSTGSSSTISTGSSVQKVALPTRHESIHKSLDSLQAMTRRILGSTMSSH